MLRFQVLVFFFAKITCKLLSDSNDWSAHGTGNIVPSSMLATATEARGRVEENAANASGVSSEERLRQDPQALAFFQRSHSTLSLACDPPDPFSRPLASALPLAERPHLLVPGAARDDLFGLGVESWMLPTEANVPPGAWARPPLSLALGFASSATRAPDAAGASGRLVLRLAARTTGGGIRSLLRRWRLTLELFSRHFLDDVGAEPGSLLPDLSELAAFTIKGACIPYAAPPTHFFSVAIAVLRQKKLSTILYNVHYITPGLIRAI